MSYYHILRPLLHRLPAEAAHAAAICALRHRLLPPAEQYESPKLRCLVLGKTFPNPVGLAAGFDKNGECAEALFSQGFGFVEIGTVTAQPQRGNPKPRMFRLPEDAGVINRLGFNSKGADYVAKRLSTVRKNILGINIGKNKTSEDAVGDYVALLKRFYMYADYITVNISSPNTPGLRDLQQRKTLEELIDALFKTRMELAKNYQRFIAILIKISPDISDAEKNDIAEVALNKGVDGLIIGNTTISRAGTLKSPHKIEQGGLSGAPLFSLSTSVLHDMYKLTQGKIPLVGVGGISSGEDAYAKIKAGASLVQLYTALAYQGFGLVTSIKKTLVQLLERDGLHSISQAVGVEAR